MASETVDSAQSWLQHEVSQINGWILGWHLERVFTKLHDSSENVWAKLSPEVQNVMKDSSAVVEIIKQAKDFAPQFVLDKIHEKLPFFTPERLTSSIVMVSNVLHTGMDANNPDLVKMIEGAQKKMAELGDAWEGYASDLAAWIAFYNTPQENSYTVIASLMKFVFQTFIKGRYAI